MQYLQTQKPWRKMEQQLTINFMNEASPSPTNNKRYSDIELQQFKSLIDRKLSVAIQTFNELKEILSGNSENGTSDTSWSFKADDGSQNNTKDETTILCHKQEVFIVSLRMALVRIEKGTYGICVNTGELIDKNRLFAVPNTTTSLHAKVENQNRIIIIETNQE